MYSPETFAIALLLTILSAVCWGSWANTFKGAKDYPFALFYWDYIVGVVICALIFAFTLGSTGATGEPFLQNLGDTSASNVGSALIGGFIFNIANLLLVAAIDIAGLTVAFPIAIGIAVVEGVVLSYLLQPKGNVWFLAAGVVLALVAVLLNARAYNELSKQKKLELGKSDAATRIVEADIGAQGRASPSRGVIISVVAGLLMGAFPPFVAQSMTHGHPMTPYSVAVMFALGAFLCCFVVNVWFMRRPLHGNPVSFGEFWHARPANHLLGLFGGVVWCTGTCFNFIAAGFVGVPISYAIGQSAPMIAACWGVFVWKEFNNAGKAAWQSLYLMFLSYAAAVSLIAFAYRA